MRKLLFLLLIFIGTSCSVEKSIEKGEFDAVISKLGDDPNKNTTEQNVTVGDAYRNSNRLIEAIPFYQAAVNEGTPNESANLYLAQGLKAEQKYEESRIVLEKYLTRARSEEIKKRAEKEQYYRYSI